MTDGDRGGRVVLPATSIDETIDEAELPAGEPGLVFVPRGSQVGRYVVLEEIGSGGMGVVYAAYDPQLDRRVALKILHPSIVGTERTSAGTARLLREARALARLSHPNVVAVHDAGTLGDRIFLAMEYVPGKNLREWLEAAKRPLAEILDVLVPAGQGLAAAHAAGIIHRDFKPENVLVGHDGRVRVVDFGLARQTDRMAEPAADDGSGSGARAADTRTDLEDSARMSGSQSMDAGITRVGGMVGTPAYMAPEQHEGLPADARSDQFAFCVALFFAVCGEHPFGGESLPELVVNVSEGTVREPPEGCEVPAWLRRLLVRGLSVDPAARYPSMDALLQELMRAPGRRVRWLSVGAALAVAVGAIAVGVAGQASDDAAACQGAERKLDGVWDEARKAEIERAFAATGRPFAAEVWSRTEAGLDAYTSAWVAMHREACEATAIRGEQSQDLLERRMICLGRRLRGVEALTRVLARADLDTVEHALDAVRALSPIEHCADAEALKTGRTPLSDEMRRRVDELDGLHAAAKALFDAGKYQEAVLPAREAVELGRSIGHEPSLANALLLQAQVDTENEDHEGARKSYSEALAVADVAREDHLRAAAAIGLVKTLGQEQGRVDEARTWARLADGIVRRLDSPLHLRAQLEETLGVVAVRQSELEEAEKHLRRSLELREMDKGPDHPDVAFALHNLGVIARRRGDHEEALKHYERVLAIRALHDGEEHPHTTATLNNIANVYMDLGRLEEAAERYRRALAADEKNYGEDHPALATTMNNLGIALDDLGENEEALELLERALALREKQGNPRDVEMANSLESIGNLLTELGRHDEARTSLERAIEIKTEALGADHPETAGAMVNLGLSFYETGEYRKAIDLYERAVRVYTDKLGPDHWQLGIMYTNLGDAYEKLGSFRKGIDYQTRSLTLFEKAFGPDHPHLAFPLAGLGICLLERGDRKQALVHLERALTLRQANDPEEPLELARIQLALARALPPADLPRARELARSALASYERHPGQAEPVAEARAWLAKH